VRDLAGKLYIPAIGYMEMTIIDMGQDCVVEEVWGWLLI
jgi:hypothetical protein